MITTPSAHAVSASVAKSLFAKADRNGNKSLSKSEFKRFIGYLAAKNSASARLVLENDAYSTGFRRADRNSDGKLTFAEVSRFK